MDDFYTRLARELKKSEKDIWVETVLTGEHAGEKRILAGEEDDAGDVAEGGQYTAGTFFHRSYRRG